MQCDRTFVFKNLKNRLPIPFLTLLTCYFSRIRSIIMLHLHPGILFWLCYRSVHQMSAYLCPLSTCISVYLYECPSVRVNRCLPVVVVQRSVGRRDRCYRGRLCRCSGRHLLRSRNHRRLHRPHLPVSQSSHDQINQINAVQAQQRFRTTLKTVAHSLTETN